MQSNSSKIYLSLIFILNTFFIYGQRKVCDTMLITGYFVYENDLSDVMVDDMIVRETVLQRFDKEKNKICSKNDYYYYDDYSRIYLLKKCSDGSLHYKYDTLVNFFDKTNTKYIKKGDKMMYKVFYCEIKVVYLGRLKSKVIHKRKIFNRDIDSYQIVDFIKIESVIMDKKYPIR